MTTNLHHSPEQTTAWNIKTLNWSKELNVEHAVSNVYMDLKPSWSTICVFVNAATKAKQEIFKMLWTLQIEI